MEMHALRATKPRRTRLIAGLAAAALGAGTIAGLAAPAQAATDAALVAPANLSATPDAWSTEAISVTWDEGHYSWELEEAGDQLVEYEYAVRDATSNDVVDSATTYDQTVWVDDLQPGTTYTVEVASVLEGGYSDWADVQVTTYPGYIGAPSAVAIQGSLTVGSTLSVATTGAWEAGADVAYEWFGTLPDAQSSGPVIATGPVLPLTPAHLNMAIYVVVTGTKDGVARVERYSAPNLTTRVTNPAPPITTPTTPITPTTPAAPLVLTASTPSVDGKAKVGKTLTAKAGDWTDGARLTYQWLVDGKAIKGADGRRLEVTKALKGDRISVTVTGTLVGYATVSRTSKATTKVAGADKDADKPGKPGKPGKSKPGKPGKPGKGR
jgi:hypothetical protein